MTLPQFGTRFKMYVNIRAILRLGEENYTIYKADKVGEKEQLSCTRSVSYSVTTVYNYIYQIDDKYLLNQAPADIDRYFQLT